MPTSRKPGPDAVRLKLALSATDVFDDGVPPHVLIDAERADNGDPLYRLTLTAEQFTNLLASRFVVAESRVKLPTHASPAEPPAWAYPKWLEVTLIATTNPYLQTPCQGQLMINEYSTDGHVIHASFRRRGEDGVLCAPVQAPNAAWVYRGRHPQPETAPCPNPADHEADCQEDDPGRNGDCDGHVRAYVVTSRYYTVGGSTTGESVNLCASHAQIHGRKIRKADAAAVQP